MTGYPDPVAPPATVTVAVDSRMTAPCEFRTLATMITVSDVGPLLVYVALTAAGPPVKEICFGATAAVNVSAAGIGGTEKSCVTTLPEVSFAVMFTELEVVEDRRTENVHAAFAEPIAIVVGTVPTAQLTEYWIWLIVSPKIPFVALTVPVNTDGTPDTTVVGGFVTVRIGVAETTVTVPVPVRPAPDAVNVTTVPTVVGGMNAIEVELPQLLDARSYPPFGIVKTVVTLSEPDDVAKAI